MLEVFNTLLRQLRQSVDYQLTGYHDNAAKLRTSSAEERTLQDAVIRTIGRQPRPLYLFPSMPTGFFFNMTPPPPLPNHAPLQAPLPTRCLCTRGQRSCSSSWGRSRFQGSTRLWGRPTQGRMQLDIQKMFFIFIQKHKTNLG